MPFILYSNLLYAVCFILILRKDYFKVEIFCRYCRYWFVILNQNLLTFLPPNLFLTFLKVDLYSIFNNVNIFFKNGTLHLLLQLSSSFLYKNESTSGSNVLYHTGICLSSLYFSLYLHFLCYESFFETNIFAVICNTAVDWV